MDSFLGEIRVFAFGYAPARWALCNGQLLPISQNTALFSLLGTYYGGDGKSSFALPNLQGMVPVSAGQAVSGTRWSLGEQTGTATHTLLLNEMASHNHALTATSTVGTQINPQGAQIANGRAGGLQSQTIARIYSPVTTPSTSLSPQSIFPVGGGQPHNNMMPYLGFNYCISLAGIFPSRG
jgi:microcystin-dependent protein